MRNPADPPLLMRDTIYTLSEDNDTDAITGAVEAEETLVKWAFLRIPRN